jgi:hypothetical protein
VDFQAAPGAKPLFQLWVQDGDTRENEGLRNYRASFHRGKGTSYNGGDMHELKLVDDAKPRLRLTAVDGYDLSTYQSYVKVMARGIRQGHKVNISNGTAVLAKGVFEADGPDRTSVKITLPPPADGKPYKNLAVRYQGEDVNTISLPHSVAVGQLKELLERKAYYVGLFKVNDPGFAICRRLFWNSTGDWSRPRSPCWIGRTHRVPRQTSPRDVLAYALRWYNIDENRVYVGGHSNGGNGTWFLATRYPRFFASASVSAGEPLNHLFFETAKVTGSLSSVWRIPITWHGWTRKSAPIAAGRR